ncbi:UdgX family uracil-DNA binding protein [Nocardioides sp.]|uniref:UdgX family uracil-DNA binding protein n=1 Tax=Nocardioides sp. TaxID=35761 RepID=UPI002C9EB0F1|nr:UdgX family uracil-DNA binding protein [Nocardioides sp.]HVX54008.1 UdgX family uracil-DNA binding protein [Nocardioides sp.]
MPPTSELAQLTEAIAGCTACELYRDATQAVPGRGALGAPLMLVGEQPGDREDVEGEPFVGPAGHLLDRALAEAGIAPEHVYVTNVVKHFRFARQGKRRLHKAPAVRHVEACAPWLIAELELVAPEGVVLLGGTAGKALYGPSFRVGDARGRLAEWPQERFPLTTPPWVLATAHPSAILRARDEREDAYAALVADLRAAVAAL